MEKLMCSLSQSRPVPSRPKLPRENRAMTKETWCAIRESSFFPRRTRLFPHKTSGLYPKSVASSSKISAFPRQILLSPEKSDVFWTVKVAILKCPKPGGFESRFFNIFYVHFQGKLFASLFNVVFNMFSCSTGRRFWRQPSLTDTSRTPQKSS